MRQLNVCPASEDRAGKSVYGFDGSIGAPSVMEIKGFVGEGGMDMGIQGTPRIVLRARRKVIRPWKADDVRGGAKTRELGRSGQA